MIIFLVALTAGLGLLISVIVKQYKEMRKEKQESGYYNYRFFYLLGGLVGAPVAVLLNRLLLPQWVYDEPFNPFLTAIPIVVVMNLAGHIMVMLNRRKIRPLTPGQKLNEIIGVILMLVMVVYVIIMLALH
jgi:hypothetical protein